MAMLAAANISRSLPVLSGSNANELGVKPTVVLWACSSYKTGQICCRMEKNCKTRLRTTRCWLQICLLHFKLLTVGSVSLQSEWEANRIWSNSLNGSLKLFVSTRSRGLAANRFNSHCPTDEAAVQLDLNSSRDESDWHKWVTSAVNESEFGNLFRNQSDPELIKFEESQCEVVSLRSLSDFVSFLN